MTQMRPIWVRREVYRWDWYDWDFGSRRLSHISVNGKLGISVISPQILVQASQSYQSQGWNGDWIGAVIYKVSMVVSMDGIISWNWPNRSMDLGIKAYFYLLRSKFVNKLPQSNSQRPRKSSKWSFKFKSFWEIQTFWVRTGNRKPFRGR